MIWVVSFYLSDFKNLIFVTDMNFVKPVGGEDTFSQKFILTLISILTLQGFGGAKFKYCAF